MVALKASEVLRLGRRVIESPDRWCQNSRARNRQNQPVPPNSQWAVKWCSLGVLEMVGDNTKAKNFLADVAWAQGIPGFVIFNDTKTHAEVIAMWDQAIKKAKSSPAA